MSRPWKGKPHKCMVGDCVKQSEYVWYNVHHVRGTKWKICGECYVMLGGKIKKRFPNDS